MTATPTHTPAYRSIVELPSYRKRWLRRTLVTLVLTASFLLVEITRHSLFPSLAGWPALALDALFAATIVILLILRFKNIGVYLTRGEINTLLGAERALVESQAKLQLILHSTAEAIYGIDLFGRCTFCNPASLRLLGYARPEDLLGKDMHALLHHAPNSTPIPPADCPICKTFASSDTANRCDHYLFRADGSSFIAECWSSPICDGEQVTGSVINFVDITQRIELETQLLRAARTDKLTGLPNRTVLLEHLQAAIDRHRRSPNHHYALLFLDFDRFKLVNDTLGHLAGDQLLCEIARRLETAIRSTDCLTIAPRRETTTSRLGGDEFVILLDGLHTTAEAALVAHRLLAALREPYTIADRRISSTASIGIVTSDLAHANAADALRDADTAMYEAKANGRNGGGAAALFTPSMRSRVQQQSQLDITPTT